MSIFNRTFATRIIVSAAAVFSPAIFAQEAGGSAADSGRGLQRTADLLNLVRTVFVPDQAPVLVSPAERAVVEKQQTSRDASPIVTTVPVVIMPDIVIPESDADEPDEVNTDTDMDDPPRPDSAISKGKDSGKTVSDQYPPFSYVFFFGEYVPYYRGWYYYSDRWIWGRRGVIPLNPPGWVPPPRPVPFDPGFPDIGPGPRPGTAGNSGGSTSGRTTDRPSASAQKSPNERGSTIPVVPDRHRIPRKAETGIEPRGKDSLIPIAPGEHRIPRKNDR